MSCPQPLRIYADSSVSKLGIYDNYKNYLYKFGIIGFDSKGNMYYKVPCGWCLNCRIDKRQWLEDAAKYEYSHIYNNIGSFVTLTYDNFHILNNVVKTRDIFGNYKSVFEDNGQVRLTCRFKDGVDFIKRLRSYITYHKLDCPAIRKDFKYIMCTEYGEEKNRCHIHLLLFGLHPKTCFQMINKVWSKGIIDCGEIENGGIRYIVDYLDKIPMGSKYKLEMEQLGIEPPKMKHSKGIGRSLIFDNLDFILKNDLKYSCGAFGKTRPIPIYWKKVLLKRKTSFTQLINNISQKMENYQIEKKSRNYSFSEMNRFLAEQSFNQHKKEESRLRNIGRCPPYVLYQNYGDDKLTDMIKLANKAYNTGFFE